MATVYGSHGADNAPIPSLPIPQGALGVAWGYYNHLTNLAAATVIRYCWVPAGATIIGGFWQAADLDTGTEELDLDIGYPGDTDALGNLGLLSGDAITDFRPVAGLYVPFTNIIQDSGFLTVTAATPLEALINTDAATGGTGISKLVAFFV